MSGNFNFSREIAILHLTPTESNFPSTHCDNCVGVGLTTPPPPRAISGAISLGDFKFPFRTRHDTPTAVSLWETAGLPEAGLVRAVVGDPIDFRISDFRIRLE